MFFGLFPVFLNAQNNPVIAKRVYTARPTLVTAAVKQDTTKKTAVFKPLTTTKMLNVSKIKMIKPMYYPINSTNVDRKGVDMNFYEDISVKLDNPVYESFLEKLNISREIFPDKNKASNIYYYLPSTYTLKWDKDSGKYDFNIFYLSSQNGGSGDVLIKVKLVSNIKKEDLELAEKFLKAKMGNKDIKLMPFPVLGISIDFGSALTNFNVKPESVHINATSDYLQPIIVEWKMESNIDDFVSAMLSDFGLNAVVNLIIDKDNNAKIVPLDLQISDPVTFGKLEIKDVAELQNGWTNYLDYPVILTKLNLHYKNASTPLTYDISDGQVESKEKFRPAFQGLSNIHLIDRLWFDYTIPDCNDCKEEVRKKIIGGTSGSQITDLEIQILNIMESSGAYMYKLNIKSKQADPNGLIEVKLPTITIKEDDQNFSGGKYYVPENENLSYEYQLIQIMPDGQTFKSPWHKGDQSFLVIGQTQLENIFKVPDDQEDGWKNGDNLNSLKDSLAKKGQELIDNLFKKKEEDKKDN
jgi:hypothetical protein